MKVYISCLFCTSAQSRSNFDLANCFAAAQSALGQTLAVMNTSTAGTTEKCMKNATDPKQEHEGCSDEQLDGQQLPGLTRAMERRLRVKIDLAICPLVCILYMCCFIDRANIGMIHQPCRLSYCTNH
jgi:hypothetical protein